jgi:AcrR family transcriptional regulator
MPRRYRSRKRAEAVEETRRRILEATMELHEEQGILATSWEDIAGRAGASLPTVYRHFPSLDELVPACGALTDVYVQPPTTEVAATLFTDATTLPERIERLIGELAALGGLHEKLLGEIGEPARSETLPPPPQGPPDVEHIVRVAQKYGTEVPPPPGD